MASWFWCVSIDSHEWPSWVERPLFPEHAWAWAWCFFSIFLSWSLLHGDTWNRTFLVDHFWDLSDSYDLTPQMLKKTMKATWTCNLGSLPKCSQIVVTSVERWGEPFNASGIPYRRRFQVGEIFRATSICRVNIWSRCCMLNSHWCEMIVSGLWTQAARRPF